MSYRHGRRTVERSSHAGGLLAQRRGVALLAGMSIAARSLVGATSRNRLLGVTAVAALLLTALPLQTASADAPLPAGSFTLDVNSHDFGAVPLNTEGGVYVHVTNSSGVPANPQAAGGSAPFYLAGCDQVLAIDAGCNLLVRFVPQSVASYDQDLALTLGGTSYPFTVKGSGFKGFSVTPSLNFGPIGLGVTSATQQINIQNVASVPLPTLWSFSGQSPDWSVTAGSCPTDIFVPLAAGASCALDVTYTPSELGDASPSSIALSLYSGGIFFIDVTASGVPALIPTPSSVSFGSVVVGSSASQTVWLQNNSGRPLDLTDLSYYITSGIPFAIAPGGAAPCATADPALPYVLAVGASCSITATFSPTLAVPYSDTTQVRTHGYGYDLPMSGSGVAPSCQAHFLSPLVEGNVNMVQRGKVLPVKASVSCNGVARTGLAPSIVLLRGDQTAGQETASDIVPTLSSAAVDTTGVMRATDTGYIYNLQVPDSSPAGSQFTIKVAPGAGIPEVRILIATRR